MITMTCGATGAMVTVKNDGVSPAVLAVPPSVVTVMTPLVAPTGTVVAICESDEDVTLAAVALNVTPLTPLNPPPAIVTADPTAPLVGLNPVMAGCTVNDD